MFLPSPQTQELQNFATIADREARTDLAGGYLRGEDDYTSNFTGALRRIINANSQTGLKANSFLLQGSDERLTGTDAAIILVHGGSSKVALFEAKWPRFRTSNYAWDSKQRKTGTSHFSNQLNRQASLVPKFAVFEMFYCEYPLNCSSQPSFMQPNGSSCVWHDDAQKFSLNRASRRNRWTQSDLQSLLTQGTTSISDVIAKVADCLQGKVMATFDPHDIAREFPLPRRILTISTGE